MIILGLDPAIRTTGYGVIAVENGKYRILDCGIIRNKATMRHTECLRRISGGVRELVNLYHPQAASLESPFCGRNAKTAIILGMARGAILAALAEAEVSAYAYTPTQAKKMTVGRGAGSKEQIAVMMAAMLNIDVEKIPLDATDALSLAFCHAQLSSAPELAHLLTSEL